MKVKIGKNMKRIVVAGGVLSAIVVPAVTLVACGTTTAAATTVSYASIPKFEYKGGDVSKFKLYGMMSDPENPRWQKAKSDLMEAGSEAKFGEVTVNIQKGQVDQNNALSAELNKDVYILGAQEAGGFASQIKAIPADKPVIAYDRVLQVNSDNYNWYVTFDARAIGRLQGLSIINSLYGTDFRTAATTDVAIASAVTANLLKTPKRVVAVGGDPGDNNAESYFNGARDVLDVAIAAETAASTANPKKSNLIKAGSWTFSQIAQKGWNYTDGQTFLQTALANLSPTERNEVGAILAPNDGMATSATNAARYAGIDPAKIWITGLDSIDSAVLAINNGTGQDMTIFKPDFALIRIAVALATTLLTQPKTWTPQQIADNILKVYPSLSSYAPKLNTTDYEAPAPANSNVPKKINTLVVDPVMVTKSNLATYFKVT